MPPLPPKNQPTVSKRVRVSRVRAAASGAVAGGSGAAGTGAEAGADLLIAFVIFGPPRTKKNSSRIDLRQGRPRLLPSKANEKWERVAMGSMYGVRSAARKFGIQFPIKEDVDATTLASRVPEAPPLVRRKTSSPLPTVASVITPNF